MRKDTNETVVDIVRELRSEPLAEGDAKPWLHYLADRIEAAHKRELEATREYSSQVGNAAATRNALESVRNWCINKLVNAAHQLTVEGLFSFVNSALSVPPRNCDAFSKEQILEMLEDRSFSKEDTIEWLFAEAKGETDGSK